MKIDRRTHKRYMKLAYKFLKKGNTNYALKYFLKGLRSFPRNSEFFIGAGFCFMIRGETDFAIENLKKAVKIDPFNSVGYLTLVECFIKAGEYREAFVYYNYIDRSLVDSQGMNSDLLDSLALKTDYDCCTYFLEKQGFGEGVKVSKAEKMRIMYDELIRYGLENGKLSESNIKELEQYFFKTGLGSITDYLMNERAGKALVINEKYSDFKKENPYFLEALKELNILCDI